MALDWNSVKLENEKGKELSLKGSIVLSVISSILRNQFQVGVAWQILL